MRGLDSYERSDKKWHRHWVWQKAAQMVHVPVRQANVLYLLGPDPQDWDVAKKRGFSKNRFFGCDVSCVAVNRARKQGLPAIQGDMIAVLKQEQTFHFDVVYFDLCCGYVDSVETLTMVAAYSQATSKDTVFIINLLRGREATESSVHTMNIYRGEDKMLWTDQRSEPIGKHRAKILHAKLVTDCLLSPFLEDIFEREGLADGTVPVMDWLDGNIDIACDLFTKYAQSDAGGYARIRIAEKAKARFATYRSGNQTMDSSASYLYWKHLTEYRWYTFDSALTVFTNKGHAQKYERDDPMLNRRLGAMKAVSTMRRNGTVPRRPNPHAQGMI